MATPEWACCDRCARTDFGEQGTWYSLPGTKVRFVCPVCVTPDEVAAAQLLEDDDR